MPTEADYARNRYQYGLEDYTTSTPEGDQLAVSYNPGYAIDLLNLRQKVESGQATPLEREEYARQYQAAMAVPMRDPSTLTYNAGEEAPDRVSGGSPDIGRLMLTLQDKMRQGTATQQESELFKTAYTLLADQHWRASVPQASDAFNPLGDQFFGALGTLALGATGGLAGGALAAGGGLASTLGSLGTLAGTAGTAAGALGGELKEPWLQKLGMGLGAAGGIVGGAGGLANLARTGVQSLGDAARLASNAGRVVGGVGKIADLDALKQAGSSLGTAGGLGGSLEGAWRLLSGAEGSSVKDLLGLVKPLGQVANLVRQGAQGGQEHEPAPFAPRPVSRPVSAQQAAPQMLLHRAPSMQASAPSPSSGAGSPGIQGLLQQAQQAQQYGRTLTDEDWLRQDWRLRNPAVRSVLFNL